MDYTGASRHYRPLLRPVRNDFSKVIAISKAKPLLSKEKVASAEPQRVLPPSDPDTLCTMCWDKALPKPYQDPLLGPANWPPGQGSDHRWGTKQGGAGLQRPAEGARSDQPKRAVNREHLFPSSEAKCGTFLHLSASGRISGKRCDPRLFSVVI